METLKKSLIYSIISLVATGCGGGGEEANEQEISENLVHENLNLTEETSATPSDSLSINENNYVAVASGIFTKTYLEATQIKLNSELFSLAIRLTTEPEVIDTICVEGGTSQTVRDVDTTTKYNLAIGDSSTISFNNCIGFGSVITNGEKSRSIYALEGDGKDETTYSMSYREDYSLSGNADLENDGHYHLNLDIVTGYYSSLDFEYFAINPYDFYANKTPNIDYSNNYGFETAAQEISDQLITPPPESGIHHETPIYLYSTYAFESTIKETRVLGLPSDKIHLKWSINAEAKHAEYYSYRTETVSTVVLRDEEAYDADNEIIDISVAESGEFFIEFDTGETIHFKAVDPTGSEVNATMPEGHTVILSLDENSDGDYEAVKTMSWTSFGFGGFL